MEFVFEILINSSQVNSVSLGIFGHSMTKNIKEKLLTPVLFPATSGLTKYVLCRDKKNSQELKMKKYTLPSKNTMIFELFRQNSKHFGSKSVDEFILQDKNSDLCW